MKQITAKNKEVTAIYRFVGSTIYLKCNSMQYAAQIINQLEQKGMKITRGRNWIKCEFPKDKGIILQGKEIDLDTTPQEEIETILINFFLMTLNKAGFQTKLEDIEA